jgi:hypothetical protein
LLASGVRRFQPTPAHTPRIGWDRDPWRGLRFLQVKIEPKRGRIKGIVAVVLNGLDVLPGGVVQTHFHLTIVIALNLA